MDPPIRLRLLGGFDLQVDGEPVPRLPRKAKAMLAYLVLEGGRPPAREVLGDLFWPAAAPTQMRDSLRQALFVIRQHLNPRGGRIALHQGIPLLLPDVVACDAREVAESDDAMPLDRLRAVTTLYTGPLLKDFVPVSPGFDDWLGVMRTSLEDRTLRALHRLAGHALAGGDAPRAVELAERMMGVDPLREDVHRLLLSALAQAGRRSDALRFFRSIQELLHRELQIAPSPETVTLADGIRQSLDVRATAAPAAPSQGGAPVVAVLPFQQLGPVQVPPHLVNGMVADIIAQLTGLHELSVISYGSTMTLSDSAEPREVGLRLGASYILRGIVRSDGTVVRLTKELVSVASGSAIWSHIDDFRSMPSFAEQDRIVSQLVNTLTPRVQEEELRRIRGRRPLSLTVYEKTLLARQLLETRELETFREAIGILGEVIQVEPGYAEAHALLADCYGLLVGEGWSTDRKGDVARLETHSTTALALDRDNVRALVFYGHRRALHHRDYAGAKSMFRRALDVAPNSALAMRWSSFTYSYDGDADEALRRAFRAMELSPCDRDAGTFYFALCVAYFTAGDFSAAAEWGRRALAERPVLRGMAGWAAASLAAAGYLDDARTVAAGIMAVWPERRVRDVVANHPYRDDRLRRQYGDFLRAAGFPE
ncbi:BTAD domain-containing putative transcriptional regulator [Thalassobaculum sp. OXR-137]|uniref:BTAD domain-containing putative transcriptional regulator n=1 Tax=Thalassobaculum sp. OXR-137 TaxID=3100173 RepID=UPI002AC8DF1B|nr:BTAD domain-containing putative transcriptional regulator [Thalassobaculum sp. OXR-137]WPZ32723.1 BTAD domain-containing putative transcriptional regulator [Thalassobaculum sp. OXR-137]